MQDIQITLTDSLTKEMKLVNVILQGLEDDIYIVRSVNSKLMSKHVKIERQSWANAQHSRRECFMVVWIPKSVKEHLQSKVCELFNKTFAEINPNEIKASQRLKYRDRANFKEKKLPIASSC